MHVLLAFAFSSLLMAADVPGGMTRSASIFSVGSYQLVVSPAFTIAPGGAYLSAEMRHQTNEDFGVGFGFGAGEVGFNFGFNGVWHFLPDTGTQPAVALLGGMYMNRVLGWNYFTIKVAPMISKTFSMEWGMLTPYAALHFTPSFRLAEAENGFAMKASMGTEFNFSQLSGIRFWTEVGIGLLSAAHEVVVGIAYPFDEVGR